MQKDLNLIMMSVRHAVMEHGVLKESNAPVHVMSSQIISCWLEPTLFLGKLCASINIDRIVKIFLDTMWGTDGRDRPPKVQVFYGALMRGWTRELHGCAKHWYLDLKTAKIVQG